MSESGAQATKLNPLQYLSETLQDLRAKGVAPKLRVLEGEQRPVCLFDGREVVNLASNNYLGLTTHRALRRAAVEAVRKLGVGAGAVRTIAGTMKLHMDLEEQIARFKQVEACVVFQSGFSANAGTVSAILGKDDLIVSDELNHASIIDGARLSKAAIKVFKHKDLADCERILQENTSFPGEKLIITDGVFSMDGDLAKLDEIVALAEIYGAEQTRRALEDALEFQAFSCEYVANLLEQRQRLLPEPGALHLTRRQDLLDLEDLN